MMNAQGQLLGTLEHLHATTRFQILRHAKYEIVLIEYAQKYNECKLY